MEIGGSSVYACVITSELHIYMSPSSKSACLFRENIFTQLRSPAVPFTDRWIREAVRPTCK